MNHVEANLTDNAEIILSESELAKQAAILNDTYAYDAAFMVGRDLPPHFIDDSEDALVDGRIVEAESLANDMPRAFESMSESVKSANNEQLEDDTEVEQLTIEQASKILGVTEERVRELIKNDTLCCSDFNENNEPRLSAACVRAQAGKSKLEFIQEVKRLIAGENQKHCTASVDLPANADASLQKLFDASSPFSGQIEADKSIRQSGTETREIHITGIDRAAITSKNIATVLENLDFSSVRLEGAMYRIGYLEAKLDDLQKELQVLPELRTKWAKSLILERENEEYKETIAKREHELLELHQFLDRIKDSWWCRAWCWLTGVSAQ